MKTVCIYHKNCFDGICAAWVVWKKFGGALDKDGKALPESLAEFIPMNYGDSLDWLTQGWNQGIYSQEDNLIIVDFSFPRDVMIALKLMFPDMTVLDHHKTAQDNCEGLNFCVFDMNESGASLAWEIIFPNLPIPILVKYIKDRDLWLFNETESEAMNSYIQSYPMNIRVYEMLFNELEHDVITALNGGKSILRYKNTMVEAICKNAALDNNGIPTVNTSILFSEVGHELCKMYPDKPYAQYYFDRLADNTRQWGARSIGDFDVSEVAKANGGGGHKNAAGWQRSLSEV